MSLAGPAAAQGSGEPTFTLLPPPSLNFYGSAGLIDTPSAEMLPDGQFTTTISSFAGQTRYTLTFQALPWLSASFRYSAIQNWNLGGFPTYYDRGFDLRMRLLRESRRWPAITLGLQDFAGTGIYSGEYLVATKTFANPGLGGARLPGRLKLTAGVGWGRLGSYGSFGSTGTRPPYDPTGTGGQVSFGQLFRGPVAAFGGIEWTPNDRWGVKLEYSSDAYTVETTQTSIFERKSSLNFGVEYQATPRTRLGAYYLYGSEFGVTAQFQLNPRLPVTPLSVPAPQPVRPRPDRATNPEAWSTGWAASAAAPLLLRDALVPVLQANGLVLETLDVTATTAELRFRNLAYGSFANAVGRAARALAQVMPASVETFRLVPVSAGMALSAVTLRRSDLEALEFVPEASAALEAVTGYGDAPPLADTAVAPDDLYPEYSWSLAPYFQPGYFDPQQPFRLDVGLELRGSVRPAPGWLLSGLVRQRLAGNLDESRVSTGTLPPVRTNAAFYFQSDTALYQLFAARQWRAGRDLYAKITAGYLELMYGGVAGELLWKPVSSRLGLGLQLAYARQRDFDDWFGFRDYSVVTGFASAYYEIGDNFLGQLDVGRYLAGDYGATFTLSRIFDNGWEVGGFFTRTNVSAEDFGEGSFDKGIFFRIPVAWFLGTPSRQRLGTLIRPIQRDGGARLFVPAPLYGQVRAAHRRALQNQSARVWE